jgi:glycosyltransferase involved in cell wall biosynthesis
VVAPLAVVQYGNPQGKRIGTAPPARENDAVPVLHPWWFYPPLSGSLTPLWLFARLLPMFRRMSKKYPFEVIDTHFGYPEGIAGGMLAAALDVPFTMTLRGNEPKHSQTRSGRYWMSWALRRAGRVFTVSERLRQFAIGLGADERRVIVVPNGVDSTTFFPRERAECRRKHGLTPGRPLIVSAGALVERKGHHRIVKAMAAMKGGGPKPELAIAGGRGPEGEYEEQLRQIVSALGMEADVRFLGPLAPDALAEVMSAADVFCLASSNEGWPNVVHEALACGAPVVATDVGAVPEMLGGGRYGEIVPANHPDALRAALEGALARSWDRQEIAVWGQARNWRQVAGEVLDGMQAVLAEDRREA